MFRVCLLAALLAAPSLRGAPPEVQPEYKTVAGQNLRIQVKGKDVDWKVTFSDEEAFFDQLATGKDGESRFVFQAPRDGTYYIVFWTVQEKGTGTVVKIVVGSPPSPKPPAPGPQPSEELKRKIVEAVSKDKGERADVLQLAALYREVSKLCVSKKDGAYEAPTSKELLRRMRETANTLVGPDSLLSTRTVVAEELSAVFGASTGDTPLTDAQRSQGSTILLKIAAALDAALSG